ncbi:MAG: hypothetical protein J7647_05660 [Cyanobacteria bacterium SBLK]|nr:hypothetical protein [Cyanobacteria bacterium SBLK]
MNKLFSLKSVQRWLTIGFCSLLLCFFNPATAHASDSFRACYGSDIPMGLVGAPELTIHVQVSESEEMAKGYGTVTWASVGPSFEPIDSPIEGPWFWMCTMDDCNFRFDFSSVPGARGLRGMLVAPDWGSPGTFIYEFEGGPGPVKQPAAVCN